MTTLFAHGTFTIERSWKVPPSRVFNAWADPVLKAQWFAGPPGWTALRRSLDFRTGGLEVLEGRFGSGSTTLYEARFHLIEQDRRLVYMYDLHHGDRFHSVTLSSLTLEPVTDGGTRTLYTEQIVFLDGRDGTADRRHGVGLQFAAIEGVLGSEGAMQ